MIHSSEYSMKSMESDSELSQSQKNNSIFSRIFNLFKNGLLNDLNNERKHDKTKNYDLRKQMIRENLTKAKKVTKSPKNKTMKLKNKRLLGKGLQVKKTVTELKGDREKLNIAIRPPVLESLKLSIVGTQKPVRNAPTHKVTYEGKKNNKPQIIQLGPRKAIRIDPNSSTSSVSLSPPAAPTSHSTVPVSEPAVPESPPGVTISHPTVPPSYPVVTMSPPTVPVSPLTVSLSPPVVSVSSPVVPVSPPPVAPPQSRLLFYKTMHGSLLTPTQHIAISNTSTPFRSRSRMIRVNRIEDLNEPENNKRPVEENHSSSSEGNINELLGFSTRKDKKQKKKKSRDGQKRKKRRELLRGGNTKILKLDGSNDKVNLTDNRVNYLSSTSEATKTFNINNIHNPFINNADRENAAPKMINTADNIRYIPKSFESNKDTHDLSSSSRIVFGTNDSTTNNKSVPNRESHNKSGNHFDTNLQSPNVAPKEVVSISELLMSSDIDIEDNKVILENRRKSREHYSELKWPGHDSIGDIIIKNEPTTPDKRQSNVIDSSKKVNVSNKPRLLSEIMAEKYQMDGISFLGKFRTPHIPSTADYQSSDESRSIAERKQESPVYKKFGIDIRKKRFRPEGRQDNNSNVN